MIVVRGRRTEELGGDELRALAGAHERAVVDLGTGDGRFAYAYAGEHPEALVVGVDAISERLAELSAKAARKPARGGRPNLVYVRASVEAPPAELHGVADEVHVLLPWGRLLVGTMLAEPDVMSGLGALAKPGACLHVVFNGEVWEDSTPKDMADLPPVTVGYVETGLAPAWRRFGFELERAWAMSPEEVGALPTTWSRKLSHGRHPLFVAATARFSGR